MSERPDDVQLYRVTAGAWVGAIGDVLGELPEDSDRVLLRTEDRDAVVHREVLWVDLEPLGGDSAGVREPRRPSPRPLGNLSEALDAPP